MRVLVTGGTGFIGTPLVRRLVDEGHGVFLLSRRAVRPSKGIETLPPLADLSAVDTWAHWPRDLDAVIHLAALNPARGDREAPDEASLRRANVEVTSALAERAAREGARLVFLSTAHVHEPDRTGRPIDENGRLQPISAYARSKLDAENAAREVTETRGLDLCVLRPPPVFGRGSRGGFAALAALARTRLPLPFAGLSGRRSVLSVQNCVDAILLALRHEQAVGGTFLLADDDPRSTGDLVRLIRRASGRSDGLFRAPEALLRGAARLAGRRDDFERLFGSFVVDDSQIRHRLGWRPPLSTEQAMQAMFAPVPVEEQDGSAAGSRETERARLLGADRRVRPRTGV